MASSIINSRDAETSSLIGMSGCIDVINCVRDIKKSAAVEWGGLLDRFDWVIDQNSRNLRYDQTLSNPKIKERKEKIY